MSGRLIVYFVLLSAAWGSSFLFTKLGAQEFGVVAAAFLRVGIGALFLLPAFLVPRIRRDFQRKALPILFSGMLNSGLPFALYAFAVMHISTGLTSILNATVPLIGAVIAWWWLKDRPDNARIAGLLIGMVGVVLLVLFRSTSGPLLPTGDTAAAENHDLMAMLAMLACIGATTCYGFAASFTKRYLQDVHPLSVSSGSLVGASLLLSVPAWFTWPDAMPSMQAWGALAVVGIVCTGLAYVLFFSIIQTAGPAKALTVTFVVPVFALFYGVVFLGETVNLGTLLCGLVIVCGVALATGIWKPRRLLATTQPRQ
ncbi:DMT family transporter [Hydrogenophaga sp. 5NK40-0174]|uniref:DMT family transporter n=1 Tax=Hydrogenophaga sp. 5NK40-0174 TaxID=3127649 RepID=UPI00310C62B0